MRPNTGFQTRPWKMTILYLLLFCGTLGCFHSGNAFLNLISFWVTAFCIDRENGSRGRSYTFPAQLVTVPELIGFFSLNWLFQFEFECRARGADILAYPPVVAGGNRSNTLHYVKNNQLIQVNQMPSMCLNSSVLILCLYVLLAHSPAPYPWLQQAHLVPLVPLLRQEVLKQIGWSERIFTQQQEMGA